MTLRLILIRFSPPFVVALISAGACGRRVFVELIFLDEWLGSCCTFVQINFKVVRSALEIPKLFFDGLNFASFVGDGRFSDAARSKGRNFDGL